MRRAVLCLAVLAALACVPAAGAGSARAVEVKVYFGFGDTGSSCSRVRARPRSVTSSRVLREAMAALLRGPTRAERRRGYGYEWLQRPAPRPST